MEIVILQVFVTSVLVFGSILLFAVSWRQKDFDHGDRLALLPLEDERTVTAPTEGPPPA